MCSVAVTTTDLSRLDRAMGGQPVGPSNEPRYCLLVFGPEAHTRSWILVDAERVQVERDGELETCRLESCEEHGKWRECLIGDVVEQGGKTRHRDLRLILAGDQVALTLRSHGWGMKDIGYLVEGPKLAARPANAPVVHFNGSQAFHLSLWENGSEPTLAARIGTPGVGDNSFASITHSVAEQVNSRPIAEVDSPSPGGVRKEQVVLNWDS
jgi:hypothetical protein